MSQLIFKSTGDYYSDVTPHVDYFLFETNNLAGHWLNKPDLNFNLKMIVYVTKVKKIS